MSSEPVMIISGKVHYLEKIALAPNSTLYVQLLDVSLADIPTKELAWQIIPNAETAGLNFTLYYRQADVLPGHSYDISACIKVGDTLIFGTTQSHPVLLGPNALQSQEVLVCKIG
jgi:putative lipoprotein